MPFQGETTTDNKEILVSMKHNEQVIQDTVSHEMLHGLLEDIFETLFPDIEEHLLSKKEEAFVRLFNPRFLQFIQDNPKWIKYLAQKKSC